MVRKSASKGIWKCMEALRQAKTKPELEVDEAQFIVLARNAKWDSKKIIEQLEIARKMPLGILIGSQFVKLRS